MIRTDTLASKATLNLSTNVFGSGPFIPELSWCRHLGLSAIELGPRHARALHDSPDLRSQFREGLQEHEIRPASLHAWTEIDGLDEVCPRARDLGAGLVVVHCPPKMLEDDFGACVSTAAYWHAWCRDRELTFTVENASSQILEPFVRFFEAVPELPLTLDIRHAYKPDRLGWTHKDFLSALGDRVANWHLAGIDPSRRPVCGDGTPPGNDAIDWNELVDEMIRRQYRGIFTIETTLPSRYTAEEHEVAYADIPPRSPEENTVSRRLSRHSVEFFRNTFSALLHEPDFEPL